LSFTNSGQPASGLDSQLSAENDDFKKHRNDSKGRFPPNCSEGMTVGYFERMTERIDCHASFHSARNDSLKNIRNGKGNNAKTRHAEPCIKTLQGRPVSASVF
jgi:hypothetical protein